MLFAAAGSAAGPRRADAIDEYVRGEMAAKHLPGVVVTIIRDGKAERISAYGTANFETKSQVSPDSVFRIASISKQFTAAAALLSVREGKLKLDEPISTYLSNVPATWNGVTVRHLLTHSSGIPNNTDIPEFDYAVQWTDASFLDFLRDRPLDFAPGSKFKYSNSGFSILGWIVGKVNQTTLRDYLAQRIFQPLGMNDTRVYRPNELVPSRASGYVWRGNEYRNALPIRPAPMDGSGALLTTAGDLAKWEASLLSDSVLTASEKALLWTPYVFTDGKTSRYAFGTYSVGEETFHTGSTPGFTSAYVRRPKERLTVIVLRNSGGEGSLEMVREILKRVSKG